MRIKFMDRTDLGRIVEPNVSERKVTTTLNANRCSGVEAGDTSDVPPCSNPARTEVVSERKVPVVAERQVVPEIEARISIGTLWIARVELGRYVVQRM